MIGNIIGALSPIELFNREQLTKLKTLHGDMMGTPATFNYGRAAGEISGMAKQNWKTAATDALKPGNAGLNSYFSGYNMGERILSPGSADFGKIAFRKNVRIGAAATLGAYIGSNLLMGSNNPISSTIGAAANLGMHGTIAMGLGRFVHPMAGAAYAGLGILNMVREGDRGLIGGAKVAGAVGALPFIGLGLAAKGAGAATKLLGGGPVASMAGGYGLYKGGSYIADKMSEHREQYGTGPGGGITGLMKFTSVLGGGALMGAGAFRGAGKALAAGAPGAAHTFTAYRQHAGRVLQGVPGAVGVGAAKMIGKGLGFAGKTLGKAAISPLFPAYDLARGLLPSKRLGVLTRAGGSNAFVGTRMFGYGAVAAGATALGAGFMGKEQYQRVEWGANRRPDNPVALFPGGLNATSGLMRGMMGMQVTDPTRSVSAESQIWDPKSMRSPRRQGSKYGWSCTGYAY
jgi:hypothetical protein